MDTPRQPRADARRSVNAILVAAERTLGRNPAATMEQIAEAAGVARTTIHRHFANRETLFEAMVTGALEDFSGAVEAARPETAPPLIALHQATANVLQVKRDWRFAFHGLPDSPENTQVKTDIAQRCITMLQRGQKEGLIDPDADLDWVRRVYYALVEEATRIEEPDASLHADALAAKVVSTLLHGVAPRRAS